MSQYLTIKKNGVIFGNWGGSSVICSYLSPSYSEEFVEFDPLNFFSDAIKKVDEDIKATKTRIENFREIFKQVHTLKECLEIVEEIEDLEESLEREKSCKIILEFLLENAEESKYEEDSVFWTMQYC